MTTKPCQTMPRDPSLSLSWVWDVHFALLSLKSEQTLGPWTPCHASDCSPLCSAGSLNKWSMSSCDLVATLLERCDVRWMMWCISVMQTSRKHGWTHGSCTYVIYTISICQWFQVMQWRTPSWYVTSFPCYVMCYMLHVWSNARQCKAWM